MSSKAMPLKKREILHEYGEYSILQGYILCRTGSHLLKVIEAEDFIIAEGNFFGDLIQFQAQRTTYVAKLPITSTSNFLDKQMKAQYEMMQLLAKQLDISVLPVKQRVMFLLYQMACDIGVLKNGYCCLPPILTQVEMAIFAHCTREYLNGVRKVLVEEGWLAPEKKWMLLNWERWEKYMLHIQSSKQLPISQEEL
ncbi:Crp/Fnr family transcriptional regulator [Listeria booriae]|uniref:HTH crp-type domain-containing protein n=1 Tax=Listeria booriae TaxID=1552123 RepID=A0A099VZV5_9LIST|nr:Crp/Fnr family transcriptional regulator [Listeria booriae]KGL37951.1 hypothetical protein EP57_15450 [Listeria booriae]STY45949.1 Uncharacterised protein [Listeria booriae]